MAPLELPEVPVVFPDANALYAGALRELLLALHHNQQLCLRWSEDTLRECEWALRHRPSRTAQDPAAVRGALVALGPEAEARGYRARVPALSLPDERDRHVLAAALEVGAHVLLTFNFRDFSPRYTRDLPVRVMRPDPLLGALLDRDPAAFRAAAWSVGGQTEAGLQRLADSLARGAMPRAAARLRALLPG